MQLYTGLLFLTVLLFFSCDNSERPGPQKNTSTKTEIEKIKLTSLKDEPIDLSDYKGKVVFVNFWATWCKPCVQEMPTIKNAMDSLKNEKIEFLFASDEEANEISSFENEYHHQFNYVKAINLQELGIVGLPTTFIFDKSGKQVYSEMGYQKWDDHSHLDMLLKFAKQE